MTQFDNEICFLVAISGNTDTTLAEELDREELDPFAWPIGGACRQAHLAADPGMFDFFLVSQDGHSRAAASLLPSSHTGQTLATKTEPKIEEIPIEGRVVVFETFKSGITNIQVDCICGRIAQDILL